MQLHTDWLEIRIMADYFSGTVTEKCRFNCPELSSNSSVTKPVELCISQKGCTAFLFYCCNTCGKKEFKLLAT